MAVFFASVFTLYVIIETAIPRILYRSITWFRSTSSWGTKPDSTSQSGLVRIVFFHYQVIDNTYQAGLRCCVQSSNNLAWNSYFIQFIVGLFNFVFCLNWNGFACPIPGLSPVSNLLFQTLDVFSVLFAIPLIFVLHKAVSEFAIRPPKYGVYLSPFLNCAFLVYYTDSDKLNSFTLCSCRWCTLFVCELQRTMLHLVAKAHCHICFFIFLTLFVSFFFSLLLPGHSDRIYVVHSFSFACSFYGSVVLVYKSTSS